MERVANNLRLLIVQHIDLSACWKTDKLVRDPPMIGSGWTDLLCVSHTNSDNRGSTHESNCFEEHVVKAVACTITRDVGIL